MTCVRARRLLAAYRRDEWSAGELATFGTHLANCPECRRVEASFRHVGEHVRQLPSITPPPSLRANVFAAIAAEDARAGRTGRTVAAITRDDTQPRLTAVRGTSTSKSMGISKRRPLVFGTPAAVAVAAVLLVGLVLARFLPSIAPGLPSLAENLSGAAPVSLSNAGSLRLEQYTAPASAGNVRAALASSNWIAFVATTPDGNSMLYAANRSTRHTVALLPASISGTITLCGMSDQWVLWQSGANSASSNWMLAASRLPSAETFAVMPPLMLANNADTAASTPALLSGVWVAHDTVLVALSTHASGSEIVRFDLFADEQAPVTHLIAKTAIAGHALTDPSIAGNTVYWAEVWLDSARTLHSDVWRGDGVSAAQKVTQTGLAFTPRTTAQALVWVQSSNALALDASVLVAQPAQAIANSLARLQGSIQTQNLATGDNRELAATGAADSLAVSGSVLVWRDGGQVHTFDLSRNEPSTIDRQIRGASYTGATGSSLTWGQASSSIISVFDHD